MKFEGAMTALVTPFKNGKLDVSTLRKLVEFQISQGINGLVPVGTTGESPTLSYQEHERVIRVVVEAAAGRVPVIAGTGSNSTDEAIMITRFAKKAGADGALIVTPYYNKPTQEGIFRHYQAIASKVNIPIVLYNIPGRCGVTVSPETIARLSKIPTIVCVKESTGSMDIASAIRSLCDIDILSGDDSLTLPLMSLGAKGVISVASNIVPKDVADMVNLYRRGFRDEALEKHTKLFGLIKALFVETNPIPVKTAMQWMGLCQAQARLPLCEMSDSGKVTLKKAMQVYGLPIRKAIQ